MERQSGKEDSLRASNQLKKDLASSNGILLSTKVVKLLLALFQMENSSFVRKENKVEKALKNIWFLFAIGTQNRHTWSIVWSMKLLRIYDLDTGKTFLFIKDE